MVHSAVSHISPADTSDNLWIRLSKTLSQAAAIHVWGVWVPLNLFLRVGRLQEQQKEEGRVISKS